MPANLDSVIKITYQVLCMADLVVFFLLLGFVGFFLFVLFDYYAKIFISQTELIKAITSSNHETHKLFLESVSEMQTEHFATLEKHSSKMFIQMDKQQKELLKFFKATPAQSPKPILDIINDIEEKTVDDIEMSEDMKIPILDGMKVQFEDESSSFPINIEGVN